MTDDATATVAAASGSNNNGTVLHASLKSAPAVPGRRQFFTYRDLGVAEASRGRFTAQVQQTKRGLGEATGWHYHTCVAQFVYILEGWVDLAFEDGRQCHLQRGDACFIPGGIRHNETDMSQNCQALEIHMPTGSMGTVPVDRPAGSDATEDPMPDHSQAAAAVKPASNENGTVHHASTETAPVVQGRRAFFTYRDLGTADASRGKFSAQVHQTVKGLEAPTGWHYHTCDSQFIYILKGWVDLEFEDGQKCHLEEGHSCYIPGGVRHNETAMSDNYEVLEVYMPADRMGTVPCDPPKG